MRLGYATAAMLAVAIGACSRESNTTVTIPTVSPPPSTQAEQKIETAGAFIDDASITTKVKAAYVADPRVKGFSIDVDTKDNVVTLNGAVQNAQAREQAALIAKGVEGVKGVKNNLTVSE